ncbi:MAG: general secretion pathway protein GspB [Oceanospirillaceae bacterium]|nr:general secretion pathway protein GspB [Oceanospirillaceae bacterium]MCP5350368.1 general secretion pathway protein GspB [Oceanospirillaceae bacterium]
MKTYWVFSICLLMLQAQVQAVPDPMAPPGYGMTGPGKTPVPVKPAWVLNQVLVAGPRKVAVINGQALHEGERWQGLTLLQITQEKVVIEEKGRRRELMLPPPPNSIRQ